MSDSNSPSNQTAVVMDLWTGLDHPPDGFGPPPPASPAPGD